MGVCCASFYNSFYLVQACAFTWHAWCGSEAAIHLPNATPANCAVLSPQDVRVEIFAAGDGINYPTTGHIVVCHYTGFLPDGTQFDSSRERGKPFRFKLGSEQVIPGLDKVKYRPHRSVCEVCFSL